LGGRWETKSGRAGSFPVDHPLKSPEAVEDFPLPSPDDPAVVKGWRNHFQKLIGVKA